MGAWIEIINFSNPYSKWSVAPIVGAWIEIRIDVTQNGITTVAPIVGAWIEIRETLGGFTPSQSLLSWERGLKYPSLRHFHTHQRRSYRGSVDWNITRFTLSENKQTSLLSWERGLKLGLSALYMRLMPVAPIVGAWIEIKLYITNNSQALCYCIVKIFKTVTKTLL